MIGEDYTHLEEFEWGLGLLEEVEMSVVAVGLFERVAGMLEMALVVAELEEVLMVDMYVEDLLQVVLLALKLVI